MNDQDRSKVGPGPRPDWEQEMRQRGEHIQLVVGKTPSEDQVLTVGGTPIRGIARITIEDDATNGRIVTLRCRNVDIVSDEALDLYFQGHQVVDE